VTTRPAAPEPTRHRHRKIPLTPLTSGRDSGASVTRTLIAAGRTACAVEIHHAAKRRAQHDRTTRHRGKPPGRTSVNSRGRFESRRNSSSFSPAANGANGNNYAAASLPGAGPTGGTRPVAEWRRSRFNGQPRWRSTSRRVQPTAGGELDPTAGRMTYRGATTEQNPAWTLGKRAHRHCRHQRDTGGLRTLADGDA